MSERYFRAVERRFAELEAAIEDLNRRVANLMREGRITSVDYDQGVATVDMDGLPSRAMPWVQRAGTVKDWDPPSIGERVTVMSPSGDPGQGLILPGGWSDQNPAPHTKGGERVIQATSKIVLSVGTSELVLEPDHMTLRAERIDLNP